jgi:8-oxo-dGTP pyrophosphatase MutT (NUDIX family)
VPDTPRQPSRRDVAVAALVDEKDCVLLVRTRKLPGYWQPVGGGLEPGDGGEPRNAATRELREELGLDLPGEALCHALTMPYDFGQGSVHFFVAEVSSAMEFEVNRQEILEGKRFRVAELVDLPTYPATRHFLQQLGSELGRRPGRPHGPSNAPAAGVHGSSRS